MTDLPAYLQSFSPLLVCAARVGTAVAATPLLGTGNTPARARVALILLITALVFPLVGPHLPQANSTGEWVALLVHEGLLGAALAFVGRLVFSAVELGGTLISDQMGFGAANVLDPLTLHQVPLVAQFQSALTALVFLAIDGHHLVLRHLVDSYALVPVGQAWVGEAALGQLMALASRLFALGLSLAAPVVAAVLMTTLILAVLARVFPQLNVFLLSFPINIALGLMLVGLTAGRLASVVAGETDYIGQAMGELLTALARP